MLGAGVAEKSGWIEGLIRGFVLSVRRCWVTAGIVFACICSSVAADAGFVVLILGLRPELTQAAFRIGESVTNCCTPLMSYFPLNLIFAQRRDRCSSTGDLADANAFRLGGFRCFGAFDWPDCRDQSERDDH